MSNKKKIASQGVQPKLRFPEFRDAGDWEEKELSELGKLVSGLTYSPDDVRDTGLLVLRSSNIQNGTISLDDKVYVTHDVKGVNKSQLNDILICVRNGSKALIGKNALIPEGMPTCTHGAFMTVFRSSSWKFVFQLFQTKAYQKQVDGDLGATINSINGRQFMKYKFIVPSANEQQRIADCLSSLDELIDAEDQKLKALRAHKKGLMQELFPADGETLPKRRFPEFKNAPEWKEIEVGELFNLQDGYAFSSSDFVDFAIDTVQVIRITDINNHNKNESKVYIPKSSIEDMKLTKFWVEQGDLLLSLTGAAGFNFFAWDSEPALINQRTMKITLKNRANAAMKILLSSLIYDKINVHGSGQNNNLSKESLKAIKLLMPKPDEQQRIADCLSSIDELITAQSQKLDALRAHKKGLMQQLFPTTHEETP